MAQHWIDRRQALDAAAWVSLKECGGDPQLVAERIFAQVSTSGTGARKVAPPPPWRSPRDLASLADWLRTEVGGRGSKILVCLDDLEFEPRSIDLIEDFMLASPSEVEFAAASAADLGFSRMKARQAITELTSDTLALTWDEAKAVAARRQGPAVPESQVHSLWKRTEGWPEIFCLLVQAASESRSGCVRLMVSRMTGMDSDLDKYFRSTILNALADDMLEFCVCASILGPISPAYFNHVYQRSDGAYYIDRLSAEQMILRPLDRAQTVHAFPPLLREFLEHRFSVEYHGSQSDLLARAAQWQRQHGNSHESISLSLRAGKSESAAEIASESMMDIALRQGEIDEIQSWQGSFSDAVVSGNPTIALGLAWAQIFSHDNQRAGGLLADLRALDLATFDQQRRRQIECWRDLVSAIGKGTSDDLPESARQCEDWLNRHGDADLVCKGAILTCLSFIAASEHRFGDLMKWSQEAASVNSVTKHRYALGWLHSTMIYAAISGGDMLAAADLLDKARNDGNAEISRTPFSASLLNVLELEVRYEANQLEGIEARVDDVLGFVRQHGIVDFVFSAYRTAAAIAGRDGNIKAAVDRIQEMRVLAAELGFPRLDVLARLRLAELFVVDSAEQAAAILPRQDDPILRGSHGRHLRARQALAQARIAARQEKFHLSSHLANVAFDHARRFQLARLEISALLCAAGADVGMTRNTRAEQRVADAVDLAVRKGCYRTLLDERWYLEALGAVSIPILDLLPQDREFARREAAPTADRYHPPRSTASITLTRKELAMLEGIRAGLSNHGIAAKHAITEDTVKWHIRNLFAKLEVRNRVQAIIKAERVGILQ